jgi:hypothetical protein
MSAGKLTERKAATSTRTFAGVAVPIRGFKERHGQ